MCQEHDEESIFKAAIKLESVAERAAYIKRACGGNSELLTRVETLLKSHEEAGDFLEKPPGDLGVTFDDSPLTEGPGTIIGRYKLLQQIGEGGFGVVYMAEQREPIRRRVALKIIKLGMDTKQVIARFEAERQALALMDHPNIARVFDAGATDTGRPYFVMELVKGISITEYCDKNNFDMRQRLELFIDVCKAIQHAHQKGIIHRDIKPSNVMVTLHDGKPVPKVIDFGIAKATQQRLTEKTLFTEFKQFIGTPEYMSPEQAEMSGLDVDTRTDIYSLGVLLYELLTGTTPFGDKELRSAAYDEIRRIIREEEPPKPSTCLSTLGDSLDDVAKHRKSVPNQLRKAVRGELDWIVMMTLEKDRVRRYETANDLALDIQRHLSDEPVIAGPPSAAYRMQKFVRRNRTAVMVGLVVLASLVVGLALATTGFIQASRQRNRALVAETEAVTQRDKAMTAETEAVTQRDVAEQAQRETQLANENLAWENYVASIGLAQRLIEEDNLPRAKKLLLNCSEEYRNWEWGHLLYLCSQDLKAVETDLAGISCVAFSPDGTRIVAGGNEGVKVWDGRMEQIILSVPGHYAAFSSDGKHLLVGGGPQRKMENRNVTIWDLDTGGKVRKYYGHDRPVCSVALSPDDKLIASCSATGPAILHDVATGKERYRLNLPSITSIVFSPDGKYLATGGRDWKIGLWDAETGEFLKGHGKHIHSASRVAFTPDSRNVISTSHANNDVLSWDIQTGNVEKLPNLHDKAVSGLAISPDGKYLALGSLGATVSLYDLEKKEEVAVFKGLGGSVVAFSPDGKQVAAVRFMAAGTTKADGSWDDKIRFWDISKLTQDYLRLEGHTGDINSMTFSPDGRLLATGAGNWNSKPYNDITARIWDLGTGQTLGEFSSYLAAPVGSVGISPDGLFLATGGADIWSVRTGAHVRSLGGQALDISPVVFHPTENILASGSSDKTAKIWDLTTGQELRTLKGHTHDICGVDISPDGKQIVTASWDKTIRIWERQTGKMLKELLGHTYRVHDVAFSPDGKLIASGSYDCTARIWDLVSDRPLHVLEGNGGVMQVAFSPDGRRLLTACRNGVAKIWDVKTGRELMELGYTLNRGPSMAISNDGKTIALAVGHDAVILPAFPWQQDQYPGDDEMPFEDRIELYKRSFWQRRLANVSTQANPADLTNDRQTLPLAKYTKLLFDQMPRDAAYPELLKEAVADYTMVIQDRPDDWWLWNNRAIFYGNLGEWEKAVADHTRAIEISPNDLILYQQRSKAYMNLGQHQKAKADLIKSISLIKAPQVFIELARTFKESGQHEKAQLVYGKALEVQQKLTIDYPDVADHWAALGRLNLELSKWDKMAANYSKAIEIEPRNHWYWHERGLANMRLENWEKVVKDYSKAIMLNPYDLGSWGRRGQAYTRLEQWDKAIADFSRAIELDPDNSHHWHGRAHVYLNMRQWDKAVAGYSKAIELNPSHSHHWHGRAEAYLNMQQRDKAVADLSKAIELNPSHSPHWHRRADTYSNMRQWDKAFADFSKAIEVDANNTYAWGGRGRVYMQKKQWNKAVADFSKAIELDPSHSHHWHGRADVYLNMQQWDKAVADLSKAIELNPSHSPHWHRRAETYSNMRQWDKAYADFSKAIELDSNNQYAWIGRGHVYMQKKQWDKAIVDYSKAIELKPDMWGAWERRFQAYIQLGQHNKALADYTNLIEFKPHDPKVRVSRGDCYYIYLKNYAKALEDYSAAIELAPDFTEAWYSRALAYGALGQFEKAALDFAKAIELGWNGVYYWYYQALAELGSGNIEKYRQTCASIFERFGESEKPVDVRWVAWTCVLAPNAVEDLDQVVKLAERALESNPEKDEHLAALGAILYRAGRFEEAVRQLSDMTEAWDQGKELSTLTSAAYTWYFLAMAHHQLGNSDEAKSWFDKAVTRSEQEMADGPAWNRKLTLHLFRTEAQLLLGGQKTDDSKEVNIE